MTDKEKFSRPGSKPAGRTRKPSTEKFANQVSKKDLEAARKPAASGGEEALKPERISKLLARAGIASRRDVERMIMEGRVAVNGKVLETPALNATLADRIEVDGQPIRGIERTRLWLYHKPAGLVTTNSDPEGRPTVFENLPDDLPRVMSIGRLDINTEGLLLLTNDGGLARVLELPTTGWLRRYRVRAYGEVDQAKLDTLKDGIAVDGVLYGAIDATLDRSQGHNVWITMGLREGKNREIKNVLGALGLEVNRLIRISYGPFQLGDLAEGRVQEVRGRMLRDQLGPRLIEESHANFDAPIYSASADDEDDAAPKNKAKAEKGDWGKADKASRPRGGNNREDAREKALGRLDTRRDAPRGAAKGKWADAKPRGKRDSFERDDTDGFDKPKRPPMGQSRTANVWMAPGARPVAEKGAVVDQTKKTAPLGRSGDAPQSKRYGRTKDGAPTRSLTKHNPDRGNSYRSDEGAPRVQVTRARDADGEWIRAEGVEEKPKGRGGRDGQGFGAKRDFGAKREFGDRPARGERPSQGDRPPRGDKPSYDARADRGPRTSRDDKPAYGARTDRGERPARGDKPAFGAKPAYGDRGERGERPYSGRPSDRPAGDRPAGDKPYSGRPKSGAGAGKPFGGKPGGGKGFGGKSGGGKPSGGRGPSSGGKPSGGSFKGKR
ncbi:pseudouridine synthase [Allorhizobium terrae]|uniref:Pseudouridine synthase n=1 Tax=Allorhizobium terrae TaxID=1848972 RepID=A0A4S3ZY85_9HYPH|nr:pseudouridine synthase [Allorhizobium terrae]THF50901.1 pseudouridine synthase [Allorhizobium terrae]